MPDSTAMKIRLGLIRGVRAVGSYFKESRKATKERIEKEYGGMSADDAEKRLIRDIERNKRR